MSTLDTPASAVRVQAGALRFATSALLFTSRGRESDASVFCRSRHVDVSNARVKVAVSPGGPRVDDDDGPIPSTAILLVCRYSVSKLLEVLFLVFELGS
jgi:hypothetical protein